MNPETEPTRDEPAPSEPSPGPPDESPFPEPDIEKIEEGDENPERES